MARFVRATDMRSNLPVSTFWRLDWVMRTFIPGRKKSCSADRQELPHSAVGTPLPGNDLPQLRPGPPIMPPARMAAAIEAEVGPRVQIACVESHEADAVGRAAKVLRMVDWIDSRLE